MAELKRDDQRVLCVAASLSWFTAREIAAEMTPLQYRHRVTADTPAFLAVLLRLKRKQLIEERRASEPTQFHVTAAGQAALGQLLEQQLKPGDLVRWRMRKPPLPDPGPFRIRRTFPYFRIPIEPFLVEIEQPDGSEILDRPDALSTNLLASEWFVRTEERMA